MVIGKLPIEKQTFIAADGKTYKALEYDILQHINNNMFSIESRVSTLEKRRWLDSAVSGTAGLIGGFLAIISKKLFV